MTTIGVIKSAAFGHIGVPLLMSLRFRFKNNDDKELYAEILEIQDGRCAICRRLPDTKRLSFDHSHITNQIRGLLCTRCNSGLGYFREDAHALIRAIQYLREPKNYGEVI